MNKLLFWTLSALAGCTVGGDPGEELPDGMNPIVDNEFVCINADSEACLGTIHYSCKRSGEFLETVEEECADDGKTCVPDRWCVLCQPGATSCVGPDVYRCNDDGSEQELEETCDIEDGLACSDGQCKALCEVALMNQSYVGCEFYAVDLDNAAIENGRDAAAQQFAVVVSNPSVARTEVIVERNDAGPGQDPNIVEVTRAVVPPGDLEVFSLERREVDGASSNLACTPGVDESRCRVTEQCVCPAGNNPVCVCRQSANVQQCVPGASSCAGGFCHCPADGPCICYPTPSGSECSEGGCGSPAETCACEGEGDAEVCMCIDPNVVALNDGTHTNLSSGAYRIRSVLPIIAYQFNPLENTSVFSNDASLLLPVSALGRRYTAAGWPQTIADGPRGSDEDFDPDRDDEDLRAFLTIVGTVRDTQVKLTMGSDVVRVLGSPDVPELRAGSELTISLSAFDVLNLETAGLNADFTGTFIETSQPVAVFIGSEASDAPRFDMYENRQCCADHLEEQQYPDASLGRSFIVARTAPRSVALNRAFVDDSSVREGDEPEWIRVVGISEGSTMVETTLPVPDDVFQVRRGQSEILRADQDFTMRAEEPVAVLQILPSQDAVSIPSQFPGGDPAMIFVPPIEQWRQDYVFLTPNKYAFDFITVMAERDTRILLDDKPIQDFSCTVGPGDGIARMPDDPPPMHVIYRCQLSFPDVYEQLGDVRVEDGDQNDGVHTLLADRPVGLEVYGFDAFVSYGYAGGLNLTVLN